MVRMRAGVIAAAAVALTMMAAGCGGSDDGEAQSGRISEPDTTEVTVADVTADLRPRLAADFGPAQLLCGMTDIFGGGFAAGPLRQGNALGCTYVSDEQSFEAGNPVWLDLIVMMVTNDSYTYDITSGLGAEAQARGLSRIEDTVPEWLYRDGLTCEQLVAPLAASMVPGPDFAEVADRLPAGNDGLSYAEVVYYWFDAGRPEALDPGWDGRPCSESFPADVIDAFFDAAIPVAGTGGDAGWTDPLLTTFAIRTAQAQGPTMPEEATQIDCSLAGPVARGTVFTCAPRLNRAPDSRPVAVVNAEGGFLVGPSLAEAAAAGTVSPWTYRSGLRCEQLRAPVTAETFSTSAAMSFDEALAQAPELASQGLDYLSAVLYAATTPDPSNITFDADGWPCTEVYPTPEVAGVQQQVQYVGP